MKLSLFIVSLLVITPYYMVPASNVVQPSLAIKEYLNSFENLAESSASNGNVMTLYAPKTMVVTPAATAFVTQLVNAPLEVKQRIFDSIAQELRAERAAMRTKEVGSKAMVIVPVSDRAKKLHAAITEIGMAINQLGKSQPSSTNLMELKKLFAQKFRGFFRPMNKMNKIRKMNDNNTPMKVAPLSYKHDCDGRTLYPFGGSMKVAPLELKHKSLLSA